MQAIANAVTYFRSFSLMRWFSEKMTNITVVIVGWAISKRAVQRAIVDNVQCGSPIGRELTQLMDDHAVDEIDSDDVRGLSDYVDNAIEHYLQHETIKVDADNVEDLDAAIGVYVREELEDVFGKNGVELIAQRLSY